MATSVSFAGTSYSIPAAGELNWSSLSSFLIAVANSAGIKSTQVQTVRVATTTPVTVAAATDWAVETRLAAPGAVTVNLPAGVSGQVFVVVDGTGDANTNNITINGNGGQLINGAASFVIDHARGAVMLAFNGTGWDVFDRSLLSGTIVNADIAAAAGIVDTKLATISTALKVANTATTATSANTASAIVARDGSGNFSAGAISAAGDVSSTGAFSASSGNASGPSITFTGDTDTGIFRAAANTLAISTNAVSRLSISDTAMSATLPTTLSAAVASSSSSTGTLILSSTGGLGVGGAIFGGGDITSAGAFSASAGSASGPGITFTGDTDTGIYHSAANTLNFTTNGTIAGTVNSSQVWNFPAGFSIAGSSTLGTFTRGSKSTTFQSDGTSSVATAAVTLQYKRIDDWVTVFFPVLSFSATPAATGYIGTGGPSNINNNTAIDAFARPSSLTQACLCIPWTLNGTRVSVVGKVQINSAGTFTLTRDNVPTAFADATAAATSHQFSFTYYVGTGS